MKKILLNCLPPNEPRRPGYSLSIIKSYLEKQGFAADLQYWSLNLRSTISGFWKDMAKKIPFSGIEKDLMPFLNYYAWQFNDEAVITNIIQLFEKYIGGDHLENYLRNQSKILKEAITGELLNPRYAQYDYFYVQSKFYKYSFIPAGVFCSLLKQVYPKATIIIEAQEFPAKAMALMDSFSCYDFATWGEYEEPLSHLLDSLIRSHSPIEQVPNIVFRNENGEPCYSKARISTILDINNAPFADFSDYVEQSDIPRKDVLFPLEGGRGCHWNKCAFCYMNDGYTYRRKSPERMLSEIEYYVTEYQAHKFYFIDNEIVGDSIEQFRLFLKGLIQLRKKYDIIIDFAEIIARDVDAGVLKEMAEAGFSKIQIGYESTSDNALRKIGKKSRFAHLILASRWSEYYGIRMLEQNIIRGLPFENEKLILENINNLYYLRFLLTNPSFKHSMREICIVSTSPLFKYYAEKGLLDEFDSTFIEPYLTKDIIKPQYKFDVMIKKHIRSHPLWKLFIQTEQYYKEHKHSYSILRDNTGAKYTEFIDGVLFKSICLSSLQYSILACCGRRVVSLSEIISAFPHSNLKESDIIHNLDYLMQQGLLYYSDNYETIVSIIRVEDI